jgi:hypothetical protein
MFLALSHYWRCDATNSDCFRKQKMTSLELETSVCRNAAALSAGNWRDAFIRLNRIGDILPVDGCKASWGFKAMHFNSSVFSVTSTGK